MKIYSSIALLFISIQISFSLKAQQPFVHNWSFSFPSATVETYANSVAVDTEKNVITVGRFAGTIDLDPSSNTAQVTSSNNAAFLAKYDNEGNYLYGHYIASSDGMSALVVKTDENDNIYIAGYYQGTIDFSSLPGGNGLNYTSSGLMDVYFAKLDPSGNLIWAKSIGGTVYDVMRGMTISTQGDLVITGYFSQTADFDPDLAVEVNLTSAGSNDVFVAKYSSAGALLWAKQVGGTQYDSPDAIAVDQFDNIYVLGSFNGTADFNPDPNSTELITSAGFLDVFILKLTPDGIYSWVHGIGADQNDIGLDLTVNSAADIFYTCNFGGTVDFDPGIGSFFVSAGGNREMVVSKLNSLGEFQWAAHTFGNEAIYPTALTLDDSGRVYCGGSFAGIVDFDPDGSNLTLESVLEDNIFVSQYSADGQLIWAGKVEGSYYGDVSDIVTDGDEHMYVVGYFEFTADFAPGAPVHELTATTDGNGMIFKWTACPKKPTLELNGSTLTCPSTNVTYTWLDCDNNYSAIAGETNQTFTPTANGNYAVMVDNGFCSDTSDCVIIDFISVDELDPMKISIAPNPTQNNVTVYFNSVAKNAVVEVYDALGQLIGVQHAKHSQQQTIELPKAKGVYFVHISIDGTPAIVRRVIKR